jgi:ankyrin repeat protein
MNGILRILTMLTVLVMPAISADVHEAAKTRNIQKVCALIEKDPDLVDARDNSGRTPIHQSPIERYIQAAALLLANGSDINEKDNSGKTPLYCAG